MESYEDLKPFGNQFYKELHIALLSIIWILLIIPAVIFQNILFIIPMIIGVCLQLCYVNHLQTKRHNKLRSRFGY